MRDIVANAKLANPEDLVIGKEVHLVSNRKEIKNAKATILLSTTADRDICELPIDGVFEFEEMTKNHPRYIHGGIDDVNSKILGLAKRAYIVSYGMVRRSKNPSSLIAKILQNMMLAEKAQLDVIFVTGARNAKEKASMHDMHAFWKSMGVKDYLISRSQEALENWLERAKIRTSDAYVSEGVTKTT